MLRRKSTPVEPVATSEPLPGKKGRPTPTRKEAEAAAKARAKAAARGARGAASGDRAARAQSVARMREALRTGDERYLPARDKGAARRFVRDFVDTKITFAEWALPVVVVTLGAGFVSSSGTARAISDFTSIYIVVVAINLVVLRFQLGRQVPTHVPGASAKGLTWYMATRALQLRWIRQPRALRRVGEKLPDTYR